MIITKEDLQAFTRVYPEDEDNLQDLYIGSATDVVTSYLGYSPEQQEYSVYLDGDGSSIVYIPNKKIENLVVEINGLEETNYILSGCRVAFPYAIPVGCSNIHLTYTGGWETIPSSIKHATLRIAALLQTEAQNNIGVTGISNPMEGSRTFINYTNFSKYLTPISQYKLIR